MAEAIKLRETNEYLAGQGTRDEQKKRGRSSLKQIRDDLCGKTFDDLTAEEKDGLLKALAIHVGIIEE